MPQYIPTSIGTNYLASKAKDALRMEEKGMPAGLIFEASDVVRTPGGYMDLITSDITDLGQAELLSAALVGTDTNPPIGKYLSLPQLYRANPDSSTVTLELNPNLKKINSLGAFEHNHNNVALLYPPTNSHRSAIIPHEMQHSLDWAGANNSKLQEAYLRGIFEGDYARDISERRATAAETADRLRSPSLARQAMYDAAVLGLPSTISKTEDAILDSAERNSRKVRKDNKK